MIKFINKEYEDEFYEFELNGEKKPECIGDGLWTDGTILMLNPCYMDMKHWSELKRSLFGDSLRSILGLFRRMDCYTIPEYSDIDREFYGD